MNGARFSLLLCAALALLACKHPNHQPDTPVVSGPSSGFLDSTYAFTASASDPDGDSVSIRFSWGESKLSDWSPFVPSGIPVTMSHSWQSAGAYQVKAQAKDANGLVSGWSTNWQFEVPPALQWKYQTGSGVASSPAVSADGTVYLGSDDNYLYAVSPDGTLKWRYETGSAVASSPAIGPDGTIYVGSDDGYLYAIQGSAPLADSPWPKFHHDNQNTGRAGGP